MTDGKNTYHLPISTYGTPIERNNLNFLKGREHQVEEARLQEEKIKRDREKIEGETRYHHEPEPEQEQRRPTEPQPSFRERYYRASKRRIVRDPDRPNRYYQNPDKQAQERELRRQEREKPDHSAPEQRQRALDDLLQEAQKQVEGKRQRHRQHDKTIDRDR